MTNLVTHRRPHNYKLGAVEFPAVIATGDWSTPEQAAEDIESAVWGDLRPGCDEVVYQLWDFNSRKTATLSVKCVVNAGPPGAPPPPPVFTVIYVTLPGGFFPHSFEGNYPQSGDRVAIFNIQLTAPGLGP